MSWDILPKSNLQYFLTKLKGIFDNKVDKETGKGLFSGSYNDLTNKPSIPAAQVNSDWNASSGVAQILNKPTIPAAQVNSDWNASSGVAEILNKPSSMPASDVYAWAKAATKPSYTASEVGALASDGTAVRATADADGNAISSTYMKKGVDYVTAGKKANTTLGSNATAEGYNTTASGSYSHAEGQNTIASGLNSHAEGSDTTASKPDAHAEGSHTTASGEQAHAEGSYTTASGYYAHSEGFYTTASGNHSHAEGVCTKASSPNQHVEGKYNVEDTNGTYAHIIGNGPSDSERKNIFTVDWNGDVCAGRSNGLTNDTKLPTGADVISYLNSNLTNVATSLQATGKVTALSGVACNRIGRIAILEFDMSMSGGETSNWIDLGSIGVAPSYDVVMNIPPEALSGNAVRVRLYNSNKHLKVFYGAAASYHVRLVFFIDRV